VNSTKCALDVLETMAVITERERPIMATLAAVLQT
jgi:hypothetical protein